MLLAPTAGTLCLLFIAGFANQRKEQSRRILYGFVKNLPCIYKLQMHKITFFSKSQPPLYSQNILKTDKMYSDKTNVFASNIMFNF